MYNVLSLLGKMVPMKTNNITKPTARVWFDSSRAAGFFSDLEHRQLVALQSFDFQRPTIPPLKGQGAVAPWEH